ncbi:hypothetical protein AGMMS50267_04060 [Spirochaetia bacterium]|nr:hypothetical protein AGMMS50267_04060 [Spirochaetia bacterium]
MRNLVKNPVKVSSSSIIKIILELTEKDNEAILGLARIFKKQAAKSQETIELSNFDITTPGDLP